jgi:hypothetical protein
VVDPGVVLDSAPEGSRVVLSSTAVEHQVVPLVGGIEVLSY